jgi:hypothetical protein
MFNKLFKTKTGRILISIILGFGLAMIFRRSCKGRSCIIYNAPDPNEIKNKTYRFDGKCVKLNPTAVMCPKDIKPQGDVYLE